MRLSGSARALRYPLSLPIGRSRLEAPGSFSGFVPALSPIGRWAGTARIRTGQGPGRALKWFARKHYAHLVQPPISRCDGVQRARPVLPASCPLWLSSALRRARTLWLSEVGGNPSVKSKSRHDSVKGRVRRLGAAGKAAAHRARAAATPNPRLFPSGPRQIRTRLVGACHFWLSGCTCFSLGLCPTSAFRLSDAFLWLKTAVSCLYGSKCRDLSKIFKHFLKDNAQ